MESSKQQTAVDLFIAELKKWDIHGSATNYTFKVPLNVFIRMEMEAKQMQKEQIKKAFVDSEFVRNVTDEQYYNETYGKTDSN